ncbi:MAG: hypothetical protein FWD17_08060 [Polyangiaceae bacterium]|nr:hypothetical protein [Polyangiaceae bacterium]
MSTGAHAAGALRLPAWPRPHGLVRRSLVCAGVGLIGLLFGWLLDPRRASFALLGAWTFGVSLGLGALLLLMVDHVAKGRWTIVIRRPVEAIVAALPLYAALFVVLALNLPRLYPWAADPRTLDAGLAESIARKRAYLDPAFFVIRSAIYFAVFLAVGGLLRRWSRQNDTEPKAQRVAAMRRLSAGALPVVALAITWAAFDWTMSLEPDWSSTIFGLYVFAGSFTGAIALVAIVMWKIRAHGGAAAVATPDHAQALGRLLFAMVIFWAYMAFSQLLIYWIADLPDEVSFYARRSTGSWVAVDVVLVVGHFALPFLALLSRPLKRRWDLLAGVSAWLLVMHYVDVYWLVMPAIDVTGARPHWLDIAALLFVGGASAAWAALVYERSPPLPRHAPELASGLDYEANL